jgi:hypothetical protein
MRRTTNRQRTLAYKRLHEYLVRLLYVDDPDLMGLSVGAPPDEYSQEAAILIAMLSSAKSEEEVATKVGEIFPSGSRELVDSITRAWLRFLAAGEPKDPPSQLGPT